MIDYFVLLDLRRRPWLDEDEVKQKFHEATRRSHPDLLKRGVAPPSPGESFTNLNEAHRVLREPKLRLQHFLALEGRSTPPAAMSEQLQKFFPIMSALMQRAEQLLGKQASATNSLTLSLLKPEALRAQDEVAGLLQTLTEIYDRTVQEIQTASAAFASDPEIQLGRLAQIHLDMTFLTRWIAQLEEKKFLLTTS